jgi:hypothetical protein
MKKLILSVLFACAAAGAIAGSYDNILAAARDDRADEVINLVERGMDPNTSDRNGTTLLMFAAGNGNEQIIEFLLRNKCNILKQNTYGDTAIGLGALKGHLSVVQRLADAGAQLDGKNWNPLHYAAYAGHVEIVRWLIERNAPIDARAPNLQTALMLAAKGGHEAIIRLLIGAGANPDLEDSDSRTAYDLAILANNRAIADYLNEKSSRRQPNRLN